MSYSELNGEADYGERAPLSGPIWLEILFGQLLLEEIIYVLCGRRLRIDFIKELFIISNIDPILSKIYLLSSGFAFFFAGGGGSRSFRGYYLRCFDYFWRPITII